MNIRLERRLSAAVVGLALASGPLLAQVTASEKLGRVLPQPAADSVLGRIDHARASGLPAAALEQRALELWAKGASPDALVATIIDMANRLEAARDAFGASSRGAPTPDELAAAATALGKGVGTQVISALAESAPRGRSVAVPLIVVSSLVDRGLPAREALRQVVQRLESHASDQQLERLADVSATGQIPSLASQDWPGKRPDLGRPDVIPATAVINGAQPPVQPPRPPKPNRP